MKKTGILLIAALLFLNFSACKKDDESTTEKDNKENPTPNPGNTEGIDLGNADLMAVGVPVIDENNNVYMAFSDGSVLEENTKVICIGNDNTKKWEASLDEHTKDLVIYNNQIYLACKNKLYALNISDGSQAWSTEISQQDASYASKTTYKPCIDAQGNIIVAMDAYLSSDLADAIPARLISVSSSGNINWEYVISTGSNYDDRYVKLSAPIATVNYIYLVADLLEEFGYAFSFDGKLQHEISTGNFYNGQFHCANSSGDVFLTVKDDMNYTTKFMSLNPTLSKNWTFALPDYPANNAVVDADGNIYIGCEDGNIYKIGGNGIELWKANFGSIYVRGEMIIGADGNIYKCLQTPDYVNMETGEIVNIEFNGLAANDIAMRTDGTIVFGDFGNVNLISTGSSGIDENAQWAKYGCDQKNTSLLN